jgi:uncharacterized membrane protein
MAPLVVLLGAFLAFVALGIAGVHFFAPWPNALRFALLAMFLLTASAHFTKMRADLQRMVPPAFPNPGLLVTLTGLLELAGAVGLLFAATRPVAAHCLIALLVAMFAANAHAASAGLMVGGRRAMPLLPRAALQILFITAIALAGFAV